MTDRNSPKAGPSAPKPVDYPDETRGMNFFDTDVNLQRLLQRVEPQMLVRNKKRLSEYGEWVGGDLDRQAEYSDKYAHPVLERYDAKREVLDNEEKKRTNIVFNPAYEKAHQEAYERGTIGLAYGDKPEPHLMSFTMGYMLSQTDISVHCPVTMTGAVAYVLDHFAPADVKKEYLHEVTRMDGKAKSGGTWATELHGGSDVGNTTTKVVRDGKTTKLHGLKWFTSNANSGLAVATARPDGAPKGSKGLGLYLVPSHLKDGKQNSYNVRRLKDKLGTRALATGEIHLEGAEVIELAAPPNGLKVMMEALEYSRIHNAVGAAGAQRRAVLEAVTWATNREAFGNTIAKYPMVQDEILDMMMTQEAGTAIAFEAARTFDKAIKDDAHRPWLRIATALAKYRTAEDAVQLSKKAIEMVGGNGYTEDFPTARLFRDAMVLPVWEGPANIQALELLRLVSGKLPGDQAFIDRMQSVLDDLPEAMAEEKKILTKSLTETKNALAYMRNHPEDGQVFARKLMDLMADVMSGTLLAEEAAYDLKHGNDARKAMICRRYLDKTFDPRKPKIGADKKDDAHLHFRDIVSYAAIDPAKAGYAGTKQPHPANRNRKRGGFKP